MKLPIFVLAFSLIYISVLPVISMNPQQCLEKLPDGEKKAALNVLEVCRKKLGLKELPKLDDIDKHDFADKCLAKCLLTEFKILSSNYTVDMKAVEEYLKNVPTEKQAEVRNVWKNCGESTDKAMKADGGITEKNSCKAAAELQFCFMMDARKLC